MDQFSQGARVTIKQGKGVLKGTVSQILDVQPATQRLYVVAKDNGETGVFKAARLALDQDKA